MLWVAAGTIGAIGLAWLLMSQFSSTAGELESARASTITTPLSEQPSRALETIANAGAEAAIPAASEGQLGRSLGGPLRLAQLAYDAGMLIEPEDYSAWSLYSRALAVEPDNPSAMQGLEQVASELLKRGNSAAEQGRYADATAVADRILTKLPSHNGALELRNAIEAEEAENLAREAARAARAVSVRRSTTGGEGLIGDTNVARAQAPTREPRPKSKADEITELHGAFTASVAGNRLLAPADDSAMSFVVKMLAIDSNDARTLEAREWLVVEMLSRSRQSSEATDWEAAETWINETEKLGADSQLLAQQRLILSDRLAAMESEKLLPASTLTLDNYVPPEYPRAAQERGTEGWVDVEFRVLTDGATTAVTAVDGSHDRQFRAEAVMAVELWLFEPRMFQGRTIEQRLHTRLRFQLAD
jgi:TonB family protein